MKLKWVSSSKSLWFALQILELLEEWKSESSAVLPAWLAVVVQIIAALLLEVLVGKTGAFVWICFMDTDLEFGFLCCPETRMSFKGCWFPPQFHECTSLRSVGGAGLPALWGSHFGWRLSGLSTRKMLQSALPASFFLPVKDSQAELFIQKHPFPLCLPWTKLPLQSFLFLRQWVVLLCAWGCSFYALFFLAMGKWENEKRIFCFLDSGIPLVAHWGREKELKSMYKEGKIAKADGKSTSKTSVVILDHGILIHAEMWELFNSEGDFKYYRTMNMLQRDKSPRREAGVKP